MTTIKELPYLGFAKMSDEAYTSMRMDVRRVITSKKPFYPEDLLKAEEELFGKNRPLFIIEEEHFWDFVEDTGFKSSSVIQKREIILLVLEAIDIHIDMAERLRILEDQTKIISSMLQCKNNPHRNMVGDVLNAALAHAGSLILESSFIRNILLCQIEHEIKDFNFGNGWERIFKNAEWTYIIQLTDKFCQFTAVSDSAIKISRYQIDDYETTSLDLGVHGIGRGKIKTIVEW